MNSSKRILLAWIPAAIMVGVIVLESSDMFSSQQTGGTLLPILNWIWMKLLGHAISEPAFEAFHAALRKTGHFVGYGLMCCFFFRAWRITSIERHEVQSGSARWLWNRRWAGLALIGTAVVASGDEIHQAFIPSRTGTFHDVLLDCAGGITALVLAWIWTRRQHATG